MEDVIKIIHKNKLIAFIIKADFNKKGLEFFTPDRFHQQLAYMQRPKEYVILAHRHPHVARKIKFTQEVIFVRSGEVRVDFYDEKRHYVESRIVRKGDIVFLAFGGHGFEFIKGGEIIEVKQGPFSKKMQSVKFDPVKKEKLRIRK